MEKRTLFIVDDEFEGRSALESVIRKYTPFELIGEANSKETAIVGITDLRPDIVLLDINLGDGTGFDVLKELQYLPKVIFVTAYDEFALKAFKFNAVDYVLKPFDPLEVVEAINRAAYQVPVHTGNQPESVLKDQGPNLFHKIVLPSQSGFEVVELKNIVAIQSENNYSVFHLLSGEQKVVTRTLKYYDEILSEHNFFRCHQTNLINLNHIKKYIKGEGGEIEMINHLTFSVSRRKKEELLDYLNQIFHK